VWHLTVSRGGACPALPCQRTRGLGGRRARLGLRPERAVSLARLAMSPEFGFLWCADKGYVPHIRRRPGVGLAGVREPRVVVAAYGGGDGGRPRGGVGVVGVACLCWGAGFVGGS